MLILCFYMRVFVVVTGEYGSPKKWNFFLSRAYWVGEDEGFAPLIDQELYQSKYVNAPIFTITDYDLGMRRRFLHSADRLEDISIKVCSLVSIHPHIV